MAKMEDEIREEMAEEMEKMMNQMEETYQAKLQRETAIHEEKFSVRHSANHHSRETTQPDQEPCHDTAVMVEGTALCTRAGQHCNGQD